MAKDNLAVITLQYPDLWDGKLKILASTRDRKALLAFREAAFCVGEAKPGLISTLNLIFGLLMFLAIFIVIIYLLWNE
ncbi:hypothetical protein ES703_85684 [subsurface metagenome]